ncbi:tRNA1(Val) (adenine(37)-N6)-methyltransferase [Mesomycoplasma molare]|uniref:tRNA1(Val) (Adenine(37)-N6)-methyltransferase n=1 Tax=Mesomycoplasma molare TaxID=171288 RepID=A0ABY5TUV9_9BACT|nr:tRNA1(Val) (adenine(37)-N6)-methyltransferase [Mesomycoplasma molare]UWD34443.1 tRNA1(Val) (adenine(37)-N6)-methyltransferase [Mesomycoplasma molare]
MKERKIVLNSLGYDSNLYIYQDKSMFNYSVDTILLGNFITINSKTKRILEIGTNNAALSIFISDRDENIKIDALEIQEKAYELAIKNISHNNKNIQINPILGDFNLFYKEHNKKQLKKYDAIVCNPPFYKTDKNLPRLTSNKEMLIATHEIALNLEQIIFGSSKIIKEKGYLSFVLPIERMVDCCELLRKYNFEPKRIQFVFPRENENPKFILIESRFQSGWGTHFEKNIYLHLEDKNRHEYREETKSLYKPKKK